MSDATLDGFVGKVRERNRFGVSLPLIFATGIYALIIAHPQMMLRDPDTLWHIAIGRWIIAHSALPTHGIFSATMVNTPWTDPEWLAEILMVWGYDHFGWLGLAVGTALCEAAAVAILLRLLLRILTPAHAMIATTLAGGLWFSHILVRPYILTTPILVLWVAALVQARGENRAPSPWLSLLVVLWANLHGSFVFGIGLAGLLAGEAVLLAPNWLGRVRATREWGCFGVLAVGAALITPNGFEGLLAPFRIAGMSTAAIYITEWQGMNFAKPWAMPFELWLMTILFAALSLGWRLPPTRVGMLLLLLAMALKSVRYSEYLGMVTSLVLAPSLASQLNRQHAAKAVDHLMAELARPATLKGVTITGAILFTISIIMLPGRNLQPVDAIFPAAAVAEVKAKYIDGPVFNSYEFGGYLIFSGIEPFIDGRAELYGDEFLKRYMDELTLINDRLVQLLDSKGIKWTILAANTATVTFMDHLPGWRRLYADSTAVVHVREDD